MSLPPKSEPSESRVDRVEERIAWLERHVVEQDKAMLELSEENRRLRRDVAALLKRSTGLAAPGAAESQESDERPPHY